MKENRHRLCLAIYVALICFHICPNSPLAHDLWLNVDNHFPDLVGKAVVKVVFGHNFPHYDILLTRDKLADFSYLCPDGKRVGIDKTWVDKRGEKQGALAGEVNLDKRGTYIVSACLKRKGNKENVPSEKYGKSIMVVGKGNEIINTVFGHRIEIVPLKNPSVIRPAESVPVKILFEGKPLSTYVYATYAGYYSETEPFPVLTKSDGDGLAHVPISQPGTWMVVTNHKVDFSTSLTFQIK